MSSDPVFLPEPLEGVPAGPPPPGSVKAWFRLLRLPNQLTVPGDPLAGALLAASVLGVSVSWSPVFMAVLASLTFYITGLLANDYCDREEDSRDRPERPIPSGAVPARGVLISALVCNMAALSFASQAGAAPVIVALALTLTLWAYNLGLKRSAILGPIVMGLCRALSLLLGAAAVANNWPRFALPLLAAGTSLLYIAAVTSVARNETRLQRMPWWRISAPSATVFAGLVSLLGMRAGSWSMATISAAGGLALGLAAMAVLWPALCCWPLAGTPAPPTVQRTVGALVRGMILLQAAFCAAAGPAGETTALAILFLFPVSGWLGKWFYGS